MRPVLPIRHDALRLPPRRCRCRPRPRTGQPPTSGRKDPWQQIKVAGFAEIGANSTTQGDDGVLVDASGTAVLNVTVTNCVFTSARGDLLQCNANNTNSAQSRICW